MRRIWPLTLRGSGALLLAIVSFIAANQLGLLELVWVGVLLVMLVIGSLVAVVGRRQADITRTFRPRAPMVGDDIEVHLALALRSAMPTSAGLWSDTLPASFEGTAHGMLPAIESGFSRGERTAELTYRVTATERGEHTVGRFRVTSTDPFGIAKRTTSLGERTRVVIAPAVVELAPLPRVAGHTGGRVTSSANRLGQGADDVVARPWAPGDSMRRVHWRASAHRDELMVRQEEQETSPEATIVLDRDAANWHQDAAVRPGLDAGFERAVSLCASALVRLVHDGYAVNVIDAHDVPIGDHVESGDTFALESVLTALATVTAKAPIVGRLQRGDAGGGPLVYITGRLDAPGAASLAPLANRSVMPVLLVADPRAGALDAAVGWHAGTLTDDIAAAWLVTQRSAPCPA